MLVAVDVDVLKLACPGVDGATDVWAFPVEQLVSARFPALPLPTNIAIVLIVSPTLATISWRLIEEASLKWARRERKNAQDRRIHTALTTPQDNSASIHAK